MNRPAQPDGESALTAFQIRVARLFFALPASTGFLLAGGAALLAQHLTARPTQQLLDEAAALDEGFDPHVLAQMMAVLDRDSDSDIAVAPDQMAPLRGRESDPMDRHAPLVHDWAFRLPLAIGRPCGERHGHAVIWASVHDRRHWEGQDRRHLRRARPCAATGALLIRGRVPEPVPEKAPQRELTGRASRDSEHACPR